MRISGSGNVGIGTNNPGSVLQVRVGSNQNLGFNSSSSVFRLSAFNDAVNANVPLIINASSLRFGISDSEKMRIDSSGNVGIGTTNPGVYKLNVQNPNGNDGGWAAFIANLDSTDGQSNGMEINAGSNSSDTSLKIATHDGGTELFRVKGDGKVGIGFSSPETTLQVSGSIGSKLGTGGFVSLIRKEAAITDGDVLGSIRFGGEETDQQVSGIIQAVCDATWATNDLPTRLEFYTCPDGAGDVVKRMSIANNGDIDLNTQVYGSGIGGDTFRDLLIRNDGRLGVDLSSERYKKNIVDIGDIDWIHNLRVVDFEWKSNDRKDWGLIAEEVHEIEPKLVSYNDDGTPESVNYSKLNVLLLKEIQNLKKRIEELEK